MYLLTPEERARWRSLVCPIDQVLFAAAHQIIRFAVAQYLECDVDSVVIDQKCNTCGGAHGKPSIRGNEQIFISWSHTSGAVLVGVSNTPIGVDVEGNGVDHKSVVSLVPRVFSHEEQNLSAIRLSTCETDTSITEFQRIWTYKECLIKLGRLKFEDFPSVTAPCSMNIDVSNDIDFPTVYLNGHKFLAITDRFNQSLGSIVVDGRVALKNMSHLLAEN
jgi:4'-phosphopantetheinyl transferase